MTENPSESLSTVSAFAAYELLFAAGLVLFTPYALARMLRTPAYRAGIGQRLSLSGGTQETLPHPIWIQAVSLGEVKSVTPLVRRINDHDSCRVFLTATTETGFRVARETLSTRNTIAYFPLDLSPIVKRALARVRPRVIVLFETEIWPNFIRSATSFGIPVLIVNGRISERSFRYYRFVPRIFKRAFSSISFAGMQSAADAERAIVLGSRTDAVAVCGNMKFDATPAPPSSEEIEKLRRELALEKDVSLIVAGSTHEGEEKAVLNVYAGILSKLPRTRLLIAPRHPERFDNVDALIREAGFKVRRRNRPAGAEASPGAVILLDTVGELARVYAMASVAFVGGSLVNVGGHNIIEPASMGRPVLFGPYMHHFEDVKDAFLAADAATLINDEGELLAAVSRLLRNPFDAEKSGEAAARVVAANRGATNRYYEALKEYLR
ncbi:3-deoxy-D-manno-octulosonic acid transferase [Candidatus Poribacteria bacterium]|nr:3-deoxy-D-manno-octulosonic acid transferase [Candidatus Poribacteria bacterium]